MKESILKIFTEKKIKKKIKNKKLTGFLGYF